MNPQVIGRLTSTANQVGAVQYSYDKANRTASRQVVGQSLLNYLYDAAGNLIVGNAARGIGVPRVRRAEPNIWRSTA
jgi:hypothetical protein